MSGLSGIVRKRRWRYGVLVVIAGIAAWRARLPAYMDDWPYFNLGSRLLLGSHPPWAHAAAGLHLYGNYPRFQVGPLSLLITTAALHNRVVIEVIIMLLGVGSVAVLDATASDVAAEADHATTRHATVLVGGAALMISWAMLKEWVHPDDALAVFLTLAAVRMLVRGRPALTGVGLGLAVAAKPWAVVMVPLVLALHGRSRLRAAFAAGAVIAATWLPFVVVDRRFFRAGSLEVHTAPASVLHLFGAAVSSQPGWVRSAQLVVGLALCSIVAVRGQWAAVPLVGIGTRMLFDPGTFGYYTAGLIAAALAWELLRTPRPVPLLTLGLFWFLLVIVPNLELEKLAGAVRFVALAAAITLPLVLAQDPLVEDRRTPAPQGR